MDGLLSRKAKTTMRDVRRRFQRAHTPHVEELTVADVRAMPVSVRRPATLADCFVILMSTAG
jgi:hypothetical protein